MFATRFSTGMTLAIGLVTIGCSSSSDTDVLTYEEFKAQAYQEPDTGIYIVNGDEPVETEEQMRQMYEAFLDSAARADDPTYASTEQTSIVNRRSNGADDKWTAQQALNITYCVSQSSFGSRYNTVVNAMNSAAAAWEAASSGINFVHNTAADGNCNASTTGVVFDVRQTNTNQFTARAFFPSSSRASRNVLIASSAFSLSGPVTLTGVLRHELGHTIGLRHEHTRPESGTCFENNAWRALTSYDSASVMHYPQCNGSQSGDLVLTTRDRQGADALY